MEVLLQENAYDSNAFNVIVDGKRVDRVAMNHSDRYTQAHIALAEIARLNNVETSSLCVEIECAANSVASPYPVEELLDMARIWKSVREHNRAQQA